MTFSLIYILMYRRGLNAAKQCSGEAYVPSHKTTVIASEVSIPCWLAHLPLTDEVVVFNPIAKPLDRNGDRG